ncbi:TPA: ead/Ea22-like family protein [Escherichia coli]|nr:ead/Ea22-like family protein [Escherichia coli]HCS5215326.1 ead/Ea22-like family protein [Escherichia coli]HCS5378740.1 ead/Ea22-like family protein [Escherichia coli]HCS5383806.1 ead/Ea22-like family protein [Escherichia coli]HCS5388570.1 ead/Ea22-like family protein [Escherichia coli]
MSKIDYQALREAAEKATCGVWSLEYGEERFDAGDALIHREVVGYLPICRIEGAHPESGFDEDFQIEQQANAEFIAAANPAAVLALLDELEYYKSREERVTKLVMDNSTSWDALYKKLEAAEKRIAELEAKPVSQTYKLTFEQWLEQQHNKIDVDCGCVSTEMFMHWIRVAYEAGNSPVTPDGWISCSERMPEKGQNVLISVNFDSSLVEPLICSARYTGSTFRRGDATIKPGNGIEQATHWMPLPEPPQEVNRG